MIARFCQTREIPKSKKPKSQPKIVQSHEEPYEPSEVRVLPPAPVRTVIQQQIVPAAPAQKKPLTPTRPNIGNLWNQAGNASKEKRTKGLTRMALR